MLAVLSLVLHTLVLQEITCFGVNSSLNNSRNPLILPQLEWEVVESDYMMPSPGSHLLLLYPLETSGGYFGLAFAMPPCVESFSALMLSEENYTS